MHLLLLAALQLGSVAAVAAGGSGHRCTQATSAAARRLQAAVDAAIRAGLHTVMVPASSDVVCFGNASFLVDRANVLNIDLGTGQTMILGGANRRRVSRCQRRVRPRLGGSRHCRAAVLAGGSALVFAVGGGVLIRDSQRVTISGASIAYDPPTSAQGVIASTYVPANGTANGTTGTLVILPRRPGALPPTPAPRPRRLSRLPLLLPLPRHA